MLCKSVSTCTAIHWIPRSQCTLYSCREEVKLEVQGVGSATVKLGQEPADVVEEFAAKATEKGHSFNLKTMSDMMKYFCKYVPCARAIVSSIQLDVKGIGRLEVLPFEEPASVVERFSVQAFEKGHNNINVESMNEMLAFFCERRSCHRGIGPALKLNIGSVGTLLVRPFREPLDVVQDFAYASHVAGMTLSRGDMVRFFSLSLSLFCCFLVSFRDVTYTRDSKVHWIGFVNVEFVDFAPYRKF